jgi:hypothetical protein
MVPMGRRGLRQPVRSHEIQVVCVTLSLAGVEQPLSLAMRAPRPAHSGG